MYVEKSSLSPVPSDDAAGERKALPVLVAGLAHEESPQLADGVGVLAAHSCFLRAACPPQGHPSLYG
jgi:hypothetical protein